MAWCTASCSRRTSPPAKTCGATARPVAVAAAAVVVAGALRPDRLSAVSAGCARSPASADDAGDVVGRAVTLAVAAAADGVSSRELSAWQRVGTPSAVLRSWKWCSSEIGSPWRRWQPRIPTTMRTGRYCQPSPFPGCCSVDYTAGGGGDGGGGGSGDIAPRAGAVNAAPGYCHGWPLSSAALRHRVQTTRSIGSSSWTPTTTTTGLALDCPGVVHPMASHWKPAMLPRDSLPGGDRCSLASVRDTHWWTTPLFQGVRAPRGSPTRPV